MIPYFQFISFPLGPINIQVWGLMVSLGIAAGMYVAYWLAKKRGLAYQRILDLGFWVILMALIGGRVFYIIAELKYFIDNPIDVFKIWEGGMSISGGFVFAVIAGYLYCRKNKINFWQMAEVCVFGLPLGLFIGRLGCFFVFDHPGKETVFFLGEKYIDGVVRHNHGLYLSIEGLILFIVFFIIYFWHLNDRRDNPRVVPTDIIFIPIFLIFDGSTRLILDFWRLADPTFYGLTIAQYLGIVMIILGIFILTPLPSLHFWRGRNK